MARIAPRHQRRPLRLPVTLALAIANAHYTILSLVSQQGDMMPRLSRFFPVNPQLRHDMSQTPDFIGRNARWRRPRREKYGAKERENRLKIFFRPPRYRPLSPPLAALERRETRFRV